MNIPPEHIEKLCTSKHPYSSKKDAEARIKAARKKGRIISATLRIYKCAFCWAWHVGHKNNNEKLTL